MPRHIKTGALAGQQEEADAKVRSTVETIIADVAKRGDAAVRDLSERFDKWSPPSFRLSEDETAALVAKVAPQTIDDIKFAQAQNRNSAEIQRASLKDVEPVRADRAPREFLVPTRNTYHRRAGRDHRPRGRWSGGQQSARFQPPAMSVQSRLRRIRPPCPEVRIRPPMSRRTGRPKDARRSPRRSIGR